MDPHRIRSMSVYVYQLGCVELWLVSFHLVGMIAKQNKQTHFRWLSFIQTHNYVPHNQCQKLWESDTKRSRPRPNVILRHMKSMNNATVNLCYMLYQWVFFTHASETETETEVKKNERKILCSSLDVCVFNKHCLFLRLKRFFIIYSFVFPSDESPDNYSDFESIDRRKTVKINGLTHKNS